MVEYYPSDYAGYKLGEIDDPEEENTEETFDVSDLADYRRTEYYNPSYTGYKLGSLS